MRHDRRIRYYPEEVRSLSDGGYIIKRILCSKGSICINLGVRDRSVAKHVEHLGYYGIESLTVEIADQSRQRCLNGSREVKELIHVYAEAPATMAIPLC